MTFRQVNPIAYGGGGGGRGLFGPHHQLSKRCSKILWSITLKLCDFYFLGFLKIFLEKNFEI